MEGKDYSIRIIAPWWTGRDARRSKVWAESYRLSRSFASLTMTVSGSRFAHTLETRSFRLQGLGDHHLALEALHHVFVQPYFGRLPGEGHGVDLVL